MQSPEATKKTSTGEVRMSRDLSEQSFVKDKYYDRKIDKWNDIRENYITVGNINANSALSKIGVPEGKVFYDVTKINKNFEDHNDHLDPSVLKKVPELLNDPMVIVEYKPGTGSNTVSVYGNLVLNNKPVAVGLVVTTGNGGNVISKIRTVHLQRELNTQITEDSILYLKENKKEINAWFQAYAGIDVPMSGTQLGVIRSIDFINSISKDNGNVNRNSRDIFIKADEDYMKAVESGDIDTAQMMVEEAARAAGYNSPLLYHGTGAFGFTEFDLSKSDDGRTIFLTSNEKIASTYSGVTGTRKVSDVYDKEADKMSLPEISDALNEFVNETFKDAFEEAAYNYSSYDEKKLDKLVADVDKGLEELGDVVDSSCYVRGA